MAAALNVTSDRTGSVTLNRELLIQVRDFVLAEPERFDIQNWFSFYGGDLDLDLGEMVKLFETDCGTTACIAGAALVLAQVDDGGPDLNPAGIAR
jgi:hypothetical protein